MRKLLVLFVGLMSILFVSNTAYAHTTGNEAAEYLSKAGILDAAVFEDGGYLTRYEVLKTIMVAIGADDELSANDNMLIYQESGNELKINPDYGFYDFEEPLYPEDISKDSDYFQKYSLKGDQIALAFYNSIAKGEIINGKRYFCFEQKATVEEVLTFMVRCLKGTDITSEDAYKYACELEIVSKSEMYSISIEYAKENINMNYFCTLLDRFMEQKRYLYFSDNEKYPDVSVDTEGIMTYWQFINSKNEKHIKFSYEDLIAQDIIPDAETACAVGKIYLEACMKEPVEYENETERFYLEAKYDEIDNTWIVFQTREGKDLNSDDINGGGVTQGKPVIIVLTKNTGEVLYVGYSPLMSPVLDRGPDLWTGKGKGE